MNPAKEQFDGWSQLPPALAQSVVEVRLCLDEAGQPGRVHLDRCGKVHAARGDSVTPVVANEPLLSQLHGHPHQYRAQLMREGELVPAQWECQRANRTYAFFHGPGMVEIVIGVVVVACLLSTSFGAAGALLAFVTTLVTLSFRVTTPEARVPPLGDAQHGFPYLSGAGRLVMKDLMTLAGAFRLMVPSPKVLLERYSHAAATDHPVARSQSDSAVSIQ